jgi:LacI family transcriptional regulator
VSYVINNGPRPVAEATRQRVLQAIKKTGYRPNGIARAGLGSTQTYGLVAPDISNPFIASMAHALQREAFC